MTGPLSDIRIIELGHALAGPFAGVLLGDFGADVIKVEPPGRGDSLREMGPQLKDSGVWWSVAGRNKRSVAVDFKDATGREVVLQLIESADVVVENFRPGVLERAGLGWDDLRSRKPDIVMLRVSGFGQTGPYRSRGGFGKIAEAFSGATHLTGHPDEAPVHPSYSLGDTTAGLMGALGVMLALHERRNTGRGQHIDLALYEPLLRMIEWQVPLFQVSGQVPERAGLSFPFDGAFITDICRAKDGASIVLSAATSESVERLRSLLDDDGLLSADATSTSAISSALRVWVARRTRDEALSSLEDQRLVAGIVYTVEDILDDEHVAARGNIVSVPAEGGDLFMPGVVPRLSETPGEIKWAGPALGAHTDEVMRDVLGKSAGEVADLKARGVLG